MIPTSGGNSLFIIDYDEKTNITTYRTSLNAQQERKETTFIKGRMAYVGFYNFDKRYLEQFIKKE